MLREIGSHCVEGGSKGAVTSMLQATGRGDRKAAADLLPLVYKELRHLAGSRLAKLPPGQTLQPTALVHEAYLRLVGTKDPGWESRGHFFKAAAEAMRRIIVEEARRKASHKRGGGRQRVQFEDSLLAVYPPGEDILAIDEALRRLESEDPRKGHIVNFRFFAGLTAEETAASLGVSKGTVDREWRYVRPWLFDQVTRTRSKSRPAQGS